MKDLNNICQELEGFNLAEILAVTVIISMLAAMVAPNFLNQGEGAMHDLVRFEIATLETALVTYQLDVGEFPDTLEVLFENESGRALWDGPYLLRRVFNDPWGNNYVYQNESRDFTIFSFGADGKQGGEGDDADIILQ